MVGPCIIVANEPRAYREALAYAFGIHYPRAEVVVIEPHRLDREVAALDPLVMVSSRPGAAPGARRLVWVTLYPDGEDRAVVAAPGVRRIVPGVTIDDLLAVIGPAVDHA